MAFAFVQSGGQRTASGNNVLAFGGVNTVGNLLVAAVMFEDNTTTVTTLTDSRSNTWTACSALKSSGGGISCSLVLYYVKNCAAGANTVTLAPSASVPSNFIIHEYSGADTTAPLDAHGEVADISGLNSLAQTGNLTIAQAGELFFSATVSNRGLTAGSGFTPRETITFNVFMASEEQALGGAGSYNATESLASSGSWVIAAASFKAATGGGGTPGRALTLMGVG